MCINYRHIVS